MFSQEQFIQYVEKPPSFSQKQSSSLTNHQSEYTIPIQLNSLEESVVDNQLQIDLPNFSCTPIFSFRNSRYNDADNYIWYGEIDTEHASNCREGTIILVKKNGRYFGNFHIDDQYFKILYEGDESFLQKTTTAAEPIDWKCDVPEGDRSLISTDGENFTQREGVNCPEQNLISVLFFYTTEALTSGGFDKIEQDAELGIAGLRVSTINSRLNQDDVDFQLVGLVHHTNFQETAFMREDVQILAVDQFANQQRDLYEADVVVLITQGGNYDEDLAGTTRAVSHNKEDAFCIVKLISQENEHRRVIEHEILHTLNGAHDDKFPESIFNRGHVFKAGDWPFRMNRFTLMTNMTSKRRTRIHYFSNPSVQYQGSATGTSRNNLTRYIRDTSAFIVANHYPNTTAPFQVSLDGPWGACPCYSTRYYANVTCATPPVAIIWETSTDGTNWQYESSNEYFDFVPPCNQQSLTSIRLTVTDAAGRVEVRQKTVGATPGSSGCSTNRTNDQAKIIASIAPNPVNDQSILTIQTKDFINKTLIIRIVDSNGNQVLEKEILVTNYEEIAFLNKFRSQRIGTYYVNIYDGDMLLNTLTVQKF